jgi:hypothetical protein
MEKKDVRRLRVALSPEQETMLERLMAKWGLDRNATVARIISESAREAQKAGKGKGEE